MGIFTKTLPELIGKVQAKEEKMKDRIAELEGEIQEISKLIQVKTSELVNYELSDDKDNQNLCRSAIKDHREQIIEIQGLLEAYKDELNNVSIPEGDLSKIKAAALKEQDARIKKLESIQSQKAQLEKQTKDIQQKTESLSTEYKQIHADESAIQEVIKVLRYVDPLTEKLDNYGKRGFAMAWLHDGDTEQYFYSQGIKTRINTTTTSFYTPSEEELKQSKKDEPVQREKVDLSPPEWFRDLK